MAKLHRFPLEDAAEDAINRAQVLFTANPALGPQSTHFWQAQDRMLEEVEKFSAAWFKRRHDATRSAIELSKHVFTGGIFDPAVAIEALSDWQRKSMERIADDAKDCTEMLSACAECMVSNETDAVEETRKAVKKATSHTGTPV